MLYTEQKIISPNELMQKIPSLPAYDHDIAMARKTISQIIEGKDSRLLVVAGPCSIHDEKASIEYAHLLKEAALRYADELFIVMRAYFEKPRTIIGWKGLISDPFLDATFDMNHGLTLARKILIRMTEIGMPAATEFLDPLTSHYLADLISWSTIGARTVESQIHRELASGLTMPVGFKNTTDGNILIAIDAINAAGHPHHFLSISEEGIPSVVRTLGNKNCHIVLRGSNHGPNYAYKNIKETTTWLEKRSIAPRVMIDCSHGNSQKDYRRQCLVVNAVAQQLQNGLKEIMGIMLESHLVAGKQTPASIDILQYGQSITDACLSWKETTPLLEKLALANARRHERCSRVAWAC